MFKFHSINNDPSLAGSFCDSNDKTSQISKNEKNHGTFKRKEPKKIIEQQDSFSNMSKDLEDSEKKNDVEEKTNDDFIIVITAEEMKKEYIYLFPKKILTRRLYYQFNDGYKCEIVVYAPPLSSTNILFKKKTFLVSIISILKIITEDERSIYSPKSSNVKINHECFEGFEIGSGIFYKISDILKMKLFQKKMTTEEFEKCKERFEEMKSFLKRGVFPETYVKKKLRRTKNNQESEKTRTEIVKRKPSRNESGTKKIHIEKQDIPIKKELENENELDTEETHENEEEETQNTNSIKQEEKPNPGKNESEEKTQQKNSESEEKSNIEKKIELNIRETQSINRLESNLKLFFELIQNLDDLEYEKEIKRICGYFKGINVEMLQKKHNI